MDRRPAKNDEDVCGSVADGLLRLGGRRHTCRAVLGDLRADFGRDLPRRTLRRVVRTARRERRFERTAYALMIDVQTRLLVRVAGSAIEARLERVVTGAHLGGLGPRAPRTVRPGRTFGLLT